MSMSEVFQVKRERLSESCMTSPLENLLKKRMAGTRLYQEIVQAMSKVSIV